MSTPPVELTERESLVEGLCSVMHDAYEAAASKAGWETQERSRKPWADVPEANKVTMRAAVAAALDALTFMGWVSPEEAKAREAAARREALLEAKRALLAQAASIEDNPVTAFGRPDIYRMGRKDGYGFGAGVVAHLDDHEDDEETP